MIVHNSAPPLPAADLSSPDLPLTKAARMAAGSVPATTTLSVSGLAVLVGLAAILLAISLISLSLPLIVHGGGHVPGALYRLLDTRNEANIPALFSSFQLAAASALTLLIGRIEWSRDRKRASYWFGLGAVFAYLAIDEIAQLHEMIALLRLSWRSESLPEWLWLMIYLPATIMFAVLYIPFLLRLPRWTAALFVAGGTIFLAGAVGLEIVGLYQTRVKMMSEVDFLVSLRANLEEFCEMVGILVFIWGALAYAVHIRARVTFAFAWRHQRGEEP
jgi:hypothetical protein